MRDRIDELRTRDNSAIDVVVVTFTKARNLTGYRRRFADPFAVVTDETLELYHAVDYHRCSFWRAYGWRSIKRYAELLRGGARMSKSGEDTLQLGGNILIAADGEIAWRYAGAGPDDRPSIDMIIEQVKRL